MKTSIIILPLLIAAPLLAQPEAFLNSREGTILIDGSVDAEWSQHASHSLGENTALSWRGTYDNSYYYFLVESETGDMTSARLYFYGSDACGGVFETQPEHVYRISWTAELGLKAMRHAPDGSGTWEEKSTETVYASADANGNALELAVPASLIGSMPGAGGDVNWTQPIRMMIGARNGGSYQYWDSAFQQSNDYWQCDYGRLEFSGWPVNAIEVAPETIQVSYLGGIIPTTVTFVDPDSTLEVADSPDWIDAQLAGRSLEVNVSTNTGANRVGYVQLRGPEESAFGVLRVEQKGLHGSPWDFDYREPVSGFIYSWMDLISIPGLDYDEAAPTRGVMWSYDHGWMTYQGSDSSSTFLFDFQMGLWWWTSKDYYPSVYIWADSPGWFWYDRTGPYYPRARTFYDFANSEWRIWSDI